MGTRVRALFLLVTSSAALNAAAQAPEHYDVVALRVEFQPDTTRYSTGNGTFDGLRWGSGIDPKIDPLPHDADYFQAHLEFLRHYIKTTSGGRATVTNYLLPAIVRVSEEMGAYSPVGQEADSDEERQKLARLVQEAWTLADQQVPMNLSGFDVDSTFFLLFHAGIGRDVELLGTVLEKTPLDLPSLFLNHETLQRLGVSGVSYSGLPVTHTAIVPRTESRLGYNSITQDSLLLELSINGLLASSFFSFLGIPDLFNTATGESAIGAFGLMDPQGIFAYAGLFPPAPMAWTRQTLGWVDPVILDGPRPATVTLPAGSVARAPISEAEYFLVENRQRDPSGDGLVLQVWQNGQVVEQRVPAIVDDFSRFDVSSFIGGVVVGVDDYDFALPGRDSDGNQYAGGLLIWHVDERVIATGDVNADPHRRGIDLEEADSAQDLGLDNTPGSPFDFFYEGNPVRVVLPSGRDIRFYENQFGPATTPSSAANDGGESFISLKDFSLPGPSMTFTYQREAVHGLSLVSDVSTGAPVSAAGSVGGGDGFQFVYDDQAIRVVVDSEVHAIPSAIRPATTGHTLTTLYRGDPPGAWELRTYELPSLDPVSVHALPSTLDEHQARSAVVASIDGSVHVLFANSIESVVATVGTNGSVTTALLPAGGHSLAAAPDGTLLVSSAGTITTASGDILWAVDAAGQAAFAPDQDGIWGALAAPESQALYLLYPYQAIHTVDVGQYAGTSLLSPHITLADLNDDGIPEVITSAGSTLLAFSRSGALAVGFPVALGATITTAPLVTRTEEGRVTVWVGTEAGTLYAVTEGQPMMGFPLSVGRSITATPAYADGYLSVVTSSGQLRTYSVGAAASVLWGSIHQGGTNTRFALGAIGLVPPGDRLLVTHETYNWPNPVRQGGTFLRVMTQEDAEVDFSVVDMAGTEVHQATIQVRGGSPAEIHWEAAVASGLYYARVLAKTSDGRTDTQLVSIAVIR